MAILSLTGTYGGYYTSSEDSSQSLTSDEQKINAKYIYNYCKAKGWTINAISGMLGNMQAESSLNPGRWQSDSVGNLTGGYGLVQWTPATKYLEWAGSNPNYIDKNLDRIIYELENKLQWISTFQYPMSFEAFTKSNNNPEILASVWLKNYERAGVEVELIRRSYAKAWYEFLNESPYIGGTNKRNKFKFVLYARKLRKED